MFWPFWVLTADLKELPQIQSYDSLQSLTKNISKHKSGRQHDLVIAVSIILSAIMNIVVFVVYVLLNIISLC